MLVAPARQGCILPEEPVQGLARVPLAHIDAVAVERVFGQRSRTDAIDAAEIHRLGRVALLIAHGCRIDACDDGRCLAMQVARLRVYGGQLWIAADPSGGA